VVFIQNHDQVANTSQGLRLSELVSIDQYKVAVTLLLCSPYVPLLFMGEEFADTAPFLYFTSHIDKALAKAVTEGRRKEYAEFAVLDHFFDPQSPDTFARSKITWQLVEEGHHREILKLYRDLIALRAAWPCLSNCRKDLTRVEVDQEAQSLKMERSDPGGARAVLRCNFSQSAGSLTPPEGHWELAFKTAPAAQGTIAGHSAVLYLSRE
jgi:maltooligosyltrehalose trehalohydrolase